MASPDEDDPDKQMASTSLRVGFVLHRANDGYAARANSLQSFLDLNRQVAVFNLSYDSPLTCILDALLAQLRLLAANGS